MSNPGEIEPHIECLICNRGAVRPMKCCPYSLPQSRTERGPAYLYPFPDPSKETTPPELKEIHVVCAECLNVIPNTSGDPHLNCGSHTLNRLFKKGYPIEMKPNMAEDKSLRQRVAELEAERQLVLQNRSFQHKADSQSHLWYVR